MGHYCRICGRIRANESFSGKGHAKHQCKECTRRPKQERLDILAIDEIRSFFRRQSRISERNQERLQVLAKSASAELAKLATIVLDVAKVAPYKRRRVARLRREAPELWKKLVAFDGENGFGLLDIDGWFWLEPEDEDFEPGPS